MFTVPADPMIFSPLSSQDIDGLNRTVSAEEVKEAMFQIAALKAPGPDGFTPHLFQRYWHIRGDMVVEATQRMFDYGSLLPGLNEFLICLIPKGETPELLNQFRPISLCNVLAKLVSKILANHLKSLMCKLTGKFQSSFILGRSTTDNIVIAQELVHSLRRRKGSKGGFVMKVDLEKAYNRVNWTFLREVLRLRD